MRSTRPNGSVLKSYDLKPLYTLPGISGASGLHYRDGRLFIASDDSHALYRYDLKGETVHPISLLESGDLQEHLPKPIKPDFEALAYHEARLYLFGSGSGEHRTGGVKYDPGSGSVERFLLAELYAEMIKAAGIDGEDLNVEGVVMRENEIHFFNRGNGRNCRNGIFIMEEREDERKRRSRFQPVELPTILGRPFTFSDAIPWKEKFLFLATAEDTDNTYDDGEILGSAIGVLNADNYAVEEFEVITREHKLEGITVYQEGWEYDSFLVCEDADGGEGTRIFEVRGYR